MINRFIAASALLVAAVSAQAKPLPLRAWELQDYDMAHIRRLVDLAAENHINRLHLSHNILMYASAPVNNPQLAKDINTICEWAHEKGIKVVVWSRELTDVPEEFVRDRKIDLNDPKTWDAIRAKYVKLFEVCPGIDGVVISMVEGAVGIWYDTKVTSNLSAEDRIAKLIDTVDGVCAPLGKEVYCRTFAYTPGDIRVITEGLKRAKADVIAMPKCVPHDWQPFYPNSPEIGDTGGKRQVVEFDLGHEFTGLSRIPYICIDFVKRHLDYDVSKGADGAVFRIERDKYWALDTPNQAVIEVASALLANPSADPHKLYRQRLAERYPSALVPHIYRAFMRTPKIVEKGLFTLGEWTSNHSVLPNVKYARDHMTEYAVAKWNASDKWKRNAEEILHPTRETIRKIQADKDEALRLVNESIADIESVRPHLKTAGYENLLEWFKRERAMVEVWKPATEVLFGIEVYKASKAAEDAAFLTEAVGRLERAVQRNRKYLIDMLIDRDSPEPMDNIKAAASLVESARKALGR